MERRHLLGEYGAQMADPTPYLSTMTATSAALVSIVGGLLVARFVGLDSEQQGAQRLVEDTEARLVVARQRAANAKMEVMRRDARDFLEDPRVLAAIKEGTTNLGSLRELADSEMEDADLGPVLDEVVEEFARARAYFEAHPLSATEDLLDGMGQWYRVRRVLPDLPEVRWDGAWSLVFDQAALDAAERAAEQRRREEAERQQQRGTDRRSFYDLGVDALSLRQPQDLLAGLAYSPSSGQTDWPAIRSRRYDAMTVARERAVQHVEDLEGELARLRLEHLRAVRPDSRLAWGLGVLAVFTLVGVVLPLWVMSKGPKDITFHIQLLFWGFAAALVALLGYMLLYLVRLMTRKPAQDPVEAPAAAAP